MDKFKKLLEKEFVFLDGAMGTLIQNSGVEVGRLPEALNITKPDLITELHKKYVYAGSDIIYTSSFGVNKYKLLNTPYTVEQIVKASIKNARKATEGTGVLVALDIGPLGRLLEPNGNLLFEEAYIY